MEGRGVVRIGVGLAGLGVVCGVVALWSRQPTVSRKELHPGSEQVAEVLEVVRVIAAAPERTPEFMHSEARQEATIAVATTAELMQDCGQAQPRSAVRVDAFIVLKVACPMEGGRALERSFVFGRDGRELRILGLHQ